MPRYKSAKELGIREIEREYLLKVLRVLRREAVTNTINGMKVSFNMDEWGNIDDDVLYEDYKGESLKHCGTEACLAGHMVYLAYADDKIKALTNRNFKQKTSFNNLGEQVIHYENLNSIIWDYGNKRRSEALAHLFIPTSGHHTAQEVAANVEYFLKTGEYADEKYDYEKNISWC